MYPFSVTFTGARTLSNTLPGSKVSGMKHVEPSGGPRASARRPVLMLKNPTDHDARGEE